MTAPKSLLAAVTVGLIAVNGSVAIAQTAASNPEKKKKDALEWLDRFARYQVLFNTDDVKKLRDKVAAMSPEEAAAWWEKTAPQRQVLASPQWAETESWLRKFLDVQAKYSDEEIRYLQSEAAAKAKESALSLQEVLDRVSAARRKLVAGSQAAAETRQMELAANAAYRQEEVRRREEARKQANAAPANPFPPPPPVREYPAGYSAPLVDSLDVARWAVLRQLFPGW